LSTGIKAGDLGSRMARAHKSALRVGMERLAIIGTDCPGLNAELMAQAFHQLHSHDLVLGPQWTVVIT